MFRRILTSIESRAETLLSRNTGPFTDVANPSEGTTDMSLFTRRLLFLLFFLSGFSGLVYQVVWTRMAFASFGIITPVLSVVISVFMAGVLGWVVVGGCGGG